MNFVRIMAILCTLWPFLSIPTVGVSEPNSKGIVSQDLPPPNSPLQIRGVRNWYLIGNALTPGDDVIQVHVETDFRLESVEFVIDDQPKGHLSQAPGGFDGTIDISGLPPGKHSLQLRAKDKPIPLAKQFFYRSHPYYALLTTDWDSSDSLDSVLNLHEKLHAEHLNLKITHLLGPYTFTDHPKVSKARQAYLVDWMLRMRASFQDEIGLHIHPFCNFVKTVPGVPCWLKPSDTYKKGDSTGYTVLSSVYTEAEYLRLLKAADALFIAHKLGKPTSFRTGSWAANTNTLKALAEDGFIADSSANNWRRIREESEHDGNGVLYDWNREHWATINDLSQPYYPSALKPTTKGAPTIPILEVPDNGSMVDYVSGEEMISIFKANWQNKPLTKPTTFVFGFHPVSYDKAFHKRVEKALGYIDRYLAANDNGPVVYETLSNMSRVFPAMAQ